jgi:hypothetical protein
MLFASGLVMASTTAQAKSKGPRTPRSIITLKPITITSRVPRPVAAVEVTRLRPQLTLSVLHHPFVVRIGQGVDERPF